MLNDNSLAQCFGRKSAKYMQQFSIKELELQFVGYYNMHD
jgi:hypothetical protein